MTRHPRGRPDAEEIAAEIAQLRDLDAAALRRRWRDVTGAPPAPGLKGELLVRALAHAMQERAFGGLSLATRKQLAVVAGAFRQSPGAKETDGAPARRRLMPGTRLIRTWQGVAYEVIVIPDGFLWQGQTYGSLSTVAKAITGTNWNGWAFFGAKPRAGKASGSEARQAGTPRTAPPPTHAPMPERQRPIRSHPARRRGRQAILRDGPQAGVGMAPGQDGHA